VYLADTLTGKLARFVIGALEDDIFWEMDEEQKDVLRRKLDKATAALLLPEEEIKEWAVAMYGTPAVVGF
jgi:predicted transcriptional regulator